MRLDLISVIYYVLEDSEILEPCGWRHTTHMNTRSSYLGTKYQH
jgi:hypothetical protein